MDLKKFRKKYRFSWRTKTGRKWDFVLKSGTVDGFFQDGQRKVNWFREEDHLH